MHLFFFYISSITCLFIQFGPYKCLVMSSISLTRDKKRLFWWFRYIYHVQKKKKQKEEKLPQCNNIMLMAPNLSFVLHSCNVFCFIISHRNLIFIFYCLLLKKTMKKGRSKEKWDRTRLKVDKVQKKQAYTYLNEYRQR